MSWSMELRMLFGLKRKEVTGDWRKLRKEKFLDLYRLPNIIQVIKSQVMIWKGYVARIFLFQWLDSPLGA
jgi:hypothetical protein